MPERKFYRGAPVGRAPGSGHVLVNGRRLNPRHDLQNHSPDGFNWGYSGSGAAQLALAILAEEFDDDAFALANYQRFKRGVVARLDRKLCWDMTSWMIRDWASEFAQVPG